MKSLIFLSLLVAPNVFAADLNCRIIENGNLEYIVSGTVDVSAKEVQQIKIKAEAFDVTDSTKKQISASIADEAAGVTINSFTIPSNESVLVLLHERKSGESVSLMCVAR